MQGSNKIIRSIVDTFRRRPILLILGVALLVRLFNIDSTIIGHHSWRQADTAAMARNFFEYGLNFFYPQVDWGGDTPGYIESEFPLYPFMAGVVYQVFGVSEFWARLLSVLASLACIYFYYRLVREMGGETLALWSAGFFSFLPLQVFYSRAIMPESFMLFSLVTGVYLFQRWLQGSKWRDFLLSAIIISLAGLLKIPSLHIGLPLVFLSWQKYGKKTFYQWTLWVYALIVFLPVILWYSHAHSILLQGGLTVGIWEYGSDKWGNWDLLFSFKFWNRILFQHIAERHLTWAGFVIFTIGLFLKRKSPGERLFDYWLISGIVYVLIVARGNFEHEYYQLPLMIPAIVFVGKVYDRYFMLSGAKKIQQRLLILALALMAAIGVWRYSVLMGFEDVSGSRELKLAQSVLKLTSQTDLIGFFDRQSPDLLYLSHRKGWHVFPDDVDSGRLDSLRGRGMSHVAGIKSYFSDDDRQRVLERMSEYDVIEENRDFFIVRLPPTTSAQAESF